MGIVKTLCSFLMLWFLKSAVHATSSVHEFGYNSSSTISNTTKPHQEWVGPVGHRLITVDASGKGDFLSVQAAVDAVPENNGMNVVIQIKAGIYV